MKDVPKIKLDEVIEELNSDQSMITLKRDSNYDDT
jgi:hypothetical protein